MIFQLAVLVVGYLLGGGAVLLLLWAVGLPLVVTQAVALVLTLPLVSTLLAEGFTNLWLRTPGALGLGGLWAVFPLLVAGAVAVLAAVAAQRLLGPIDPTLPRHQGNPTGWVVVAVICSLISLALWRWWPEPRARLF